MTPATLVHRIWTTRRGVGVLIVAMMATITMLLYSILSNAQSQSLVVSYGSIIYTPDQSEYCPGEIMTFPVDLQVSPDSLPSIRNVVEAWRRDSDGVVLESTGRSFSVPLIQPMDLTITARRTVPDVKAGVYWLDHVSENGVTSGYTVGPVRIKDCP